jgi:hypothetical protein
MRLSDILSGGNGNGIDDIWDSTAAADDFGPLPAGEYIAHLSAGELIQSRTNQTPGYRMTFTVIEGDFTNRRFWHECWLTPAALPQSKRDLAKIGISKPAMMEQALPKGIRCKCKLALRKDDQGNESNRLKTFEVIGIDKPTVDEFAPETDEQTDGTKRGAF